MTPPDDFAALRAVSARFGADPLLVQGAGGNTSVKDGDLMWIKASGTLLADAETRDIFVAVDLPPLKDAVERDDPLADQPARFALAQDGLKPSIETCLHAVFPHRVVLHVHCVNTIAFAVRRDAREKLAERLGGFRWAFVDYVKPGARLAAKVRRARGPDTDVVVLGNHGLIVAAETVEAAARLVEGVAAALAAAPARAGAPDFARLGALAGAGYSPAPAGHCLHDVALSPCKLALATGGSLYPDHVVFCGPGVRTADVPPASAGVRTAGVSPAAGVRTAGVPPASAGVRTADVPPASAGVRTADVPPASAGVRTAGVPPAAGGTPAVPLLLVPGAGALLRDDASAGARAMAQCLGDVLARVPDDADDAEPHYLTDADVHELLDWDAEKYRQALNAR